MQLKPVEDQVEEQVVALMGASSGICRETALRFAREGGDGAATVRVYRVGARVARGIATGRRSRLYRVRPTPVYPSSSTVTETLRACYRVFTSVG